MNSIRKQLAAEAAEAEARKDEDPGRMHRARTQAKTRGEQHHEPDLTDVRRTLRDALTTLDNIDQHRTAS